MLYKFCNLEEVPQTGKMSGQMGKIAKKAEGMNKYLVQIWSFEIFASQREGKKE